MALAVHSLGSASLLGKKMRGDVFLYIFERVLWMARQSSCWMSRNERVRIVFWFWITSSCRGFCCHLKTFPRYSSLGETLQCSSWSGLIWVSMAISWPLSSFVEDIYINELLPDCSRWFCAFHMKKWGQWHPSLFLAWASSVLSIFSTSFHT
jgi:hypothetical protein